MIKNSFVVEVTFNFEQISYFVQVFPLLTLKKKMPAG